MIGGGQHVRQVADKLHRRIEIELGMAPVGAAWNWPFGRWSFAGLEGGVERFDPVRWNDARQQAETLRVESQIASGVELVDPCASWKFVHRLDIRAMRANHQRLASLCLGRRRRSTLARRFSFGWRRSVASISDGATGWGYLECGTDKTTFSPLVAACVATL
jgi:hypothetical protein